MNRNLIWPLGLFALALLFFCVIHHAPAIQEDVLNRTLNVLSAKPTEQVKVAVEGRNVTLTGSVSSEEVRKNATEMAEAVQGVVSVDNQLTISQAATEVIPAAKSVATRPAYKTEFVKHNISGIFLTGSVPSEEQRKVLVQLAEDRFGAGHVTDKLELRRGAPKGWEKTAKLAIENLALFNEGVASLVGSEIELSGQVVDEQAKNTVEEGFQQLLPKKFNADVNLTVPQLAAEEIHQDAGLFCAEKFNKKIMGHVIHFSNDSSGLETQAQAVFEIILEFSGSCPNSIIEVAGYTDSLGDTAYNLWLSRKRARVTMKKLIKSGMRADRLTVVGRGERDPLSDNKTRKGRADNRRIEFNYLKEGE